MPSLSAETSGSSFRAVLRWIPLLVPPLIIFFWMRASLLNVPFMDDYVWLPFYKKFHDGNWKWGDLMFVQMEHRLTVPAVLTCIFYHLAPGKIVLQNWTLFALLCLTGANLVFIQRRTFPDLKAGRMAAFVLMLVLFSPTQAYTFLWADCFSSYMAPFFLSAAFAVFVSRLRFPLKLACCVVLGVLSSVSYGSGVLIWGLMVPLILFCGDFADRRQRLAFLIVWVIAAAVTMKLYFVNLVNQAQPEFSYNQSNEHTMGAHLKAFLESPWQSLKFILMFGGSMLGRGTYAPMLGATLYAGAALALALIAACVTLFFAKDKKLLSACSLPWIMLGVYAFAMGGMVAMSRMEDSKDIGALWNRYTIHSMYAVIPVVVLGFAWFTRMSAAEPAVGWRGPLRRAAPVLLGLFVMHVVAGWIYGGKMFEAWWSSRLRDATCQLFAKSVPQGAIEGPLTRGHGFVWDFAMGMDDLGILEPPMPRTNRLDYFKNGLRARESADRVEGVEVLASGGFRVSGVAFDRSQARPADGVLLCFKDGQGDWRIFAVGQVRQIPVFVRDALNADMQYLSVPRPGRRQMFYGEFSIEFSPEVLGTGVHEIAAWTFDFPSQTVSRIAGLYRVDATGHTVEAIDDPEASRKK